MEQLTLAAARRIAIAAQGLAAPRPAGPLTMRHVQAQLDRLAQVQIDSVNVLARAHYVPLYARLGAYDKALLDRAASRAPRRVFEYWGHAAALIDVRLQPALRWRMERDDDGVWGTMREIREAHPQLPDAVLAELAERGPLTARQIEYDDGHVKGVWWNWSAVKTTLEWLLLTGIVTPAGRNTAFERVYDLTERVLPPAIVATPTPGVEEARRILVRRSAAALGVATEKSLATYFYQQRKPVRAAIADLVDAGELQEVRVVGWAQPAYLWPQARRPRVVRARTLLAPFDSMIFERDRLLALFGSHYRIEIYTPEPQRRYGYYVYPFLLGDRIAARVDLKADRRSGALLVQAAWLEPGNAVVGSPGDPGEIAAELAAELATLATWLGLGRIVVAGRGDLAPELARSL